MVLEIYGNYAEIKGNKRLLSLCREIKESAANEIQNISAGFDDENEICDRVKKFLEKSLEKLVGKRQVKKIFQNVEKTIPKLSGALCYVISEIGSRLGDMESDENDES
ncbi:MAG: hypothetical protein J6D15_05740 [Clostridia bacterium]|nr:hypothetical protein [Clostridia bacterium]